MKSSAFAPFWKGCVAGIVSLGFLFVLRIGQIAPFPPESALEAFLKIIPETVQEPSIQALGDFAGESGLIIATLIAILVYGAFGVLFEKWYAPKISSKSISKLEKFLIYSIVPFLFFGLIVLPICGDSVFGISSDFANSSSVFLFPLALLFGNMIYCLVLDWQYGATKLFAKVPASRKETISASRRSFMENGVLALGALAFLAAGINGLLTSPSPPESSSAPQGTPINLANAPSIFEDPRLSGLVDSEVTSNGNFYEVDIDTFGPPSVDASTWSLQVTGLVQNPKTYALSDLQNLPKTTEYNTFECVSNDVNGNLIGNAEWGGVSLSDLFNDMGGVSEGADTVIFYSVDGYSVGIPIEKALESDSMIAYEMNSVSLPQNHGFPLRAVIPGLYGMMSAKWIRKIQVIDTTYLGYWQTRGWSDSGEVQTLAFITVPGDGSSESLSDYNGTVLVGGYAYAGDRGISSVEVSTDSGKTWQQAVLKPAISNDTWTLWAFEWATTNTGIVNVYARATDGTGAIQTSSETSNFPNGATGYASIMVKVTK